MSTELAAFLAPGRIVDSDHPAVVAFANEHGVGATPRERAIALYYAVRDGFRYDPYRVEASATGLSASRVIELGYGFCVSKAALLAAVGRASGIPTRVGFGDVRNHLSSPRLAETMGTDLFAYHGFAEFWLDGRWVKATPAFNRSLCEKTGARPLEFDGIHDSLFQPLDSNGRKHMEYVRDRGSFADVPLDDMIRVWREVYPAVLLESWLEKPTVDGDFEQEARAQ